MNELTDQILTFIHEDPDMYKEVAEVIESHEDKKQDAQTALIDHLVDTGYLLETAIEYIDWEAMLTILIRGYTQQDINYERTKEQQQEAYMAGYLNNHTDATPDKAQEQFNAWWQSEQAIAERAMAEMERERLAHQ